MWRPKRIEPLAGQESVWDYPRPPPLGRHRDSRLVEPASPAMHPYFGCPVEPFSGPMPVSDDVGATRVSGVGLAG